MSSYNQRKSPGALTPTALIILGAILTIGIIAGIKFMVGGDANESLPQPSGQEVIFKDEKPAPYGLPGSRSEATSGDSLEMFTKANEGYSEEDSTPTAEARPAAPGPAKKAAAPAAEKKRAAKDLKKTQPRTVIPRLQGAKPFGTAESDKSKGGTVDMSELMRQAGPAQGSGD